jgi:hypothetical protein
VLKHLKLRGIFSFNGKDQILENLLNQLKYNEFNNDQRREFVNTQQRFAAWQELNARVQATRGSMVWIVSKGSEYLARSYYERPGVRKQRSLGPRSPRTERMKVDFERARAEAQQRFKEIDAALERQAAINRALGLGRVPLTGAKILRAVERSGTLGAGLRVIGTNAIFAYEAAAGVMVDPGLTTTGDIGLLMDTRGGLKFFLSEEVSERSLINLLKTVDRSFEKTRRAYRAQNSQGYMVDLIKPLRNPPWKKEADQIGDGKPDDLTAAEITGLVWLENAPSFEHIAIDERGYPLRIVAADPRVWAAHKNWVSKQLDRDPIKKRRDAEQAMAVGEIVGKYLPHLPYDLEAMKMLPDNVAREAVGLFSH